MGPIFDNSTINRINEILPYITQFIVGDGVYHIEYDSRPIRLIQFVDLLTADRYYMEYYPRSPVHGEDGNYYIELLNIHCSSIEDNRRFDDYMHGENIMTLLTLLEDRVGLVLIV